MSEDGHDCLSLPDNNADEQDDEQNDQSNRGGRAGKCHDGVKRACLDEQSDLRTSLVWLICWW